MNYDGVNELETIKGYLDSGDIVERYHYEITAEQAEVFAMFLENDILNLGSLDGQWCTTQCRDAFYNAFAETGDSEEQAFEKALKIIYYRTPENLTDNEVVETGSKVYDKYYKKDKKYYKETRTYNNESQEWHSQILEIFRSDEEE